MMGFHVAPFHWSTNVPLVRKRLDQVCHLPSESVDVLPRVSILRQHDDVNIDFLHVWENEQNAIS
jgi:hypothetical protein